MYLMPTEMWLAWEENQISGGLQWSRKWPFRLSNLWKSTLSQKNNTSKISNYISNFQIHVRSYVIKKKLKHSNPSIMYADFLVKTLISYLHRCGTVVGTVLVKDLHRGNQMFWADPPTQLPARSTQSFPSTAHSHCSLKHPRQRGWVKKRQRVTE